MIQNGLFCAGQLRTTERSREAQSGGSVIQSKHGDDDAPAPEDQEPPR
jgi:hypothetical protein